MAYRKTTVIAEHKLREYMRDHTNVEASEYFGVSVSTIVRRLKKFDLHYEELKYGSSFTDLQQELITGSLLGDGKLERKRFGLGQTSSRKEYVEWMNAQLKPFSREIYFDKSKGFGGKGSWRFVTGDHSLFKELKDKWCPKNKKVVPRDIVLSPISFVHWVMQDGSNHQRKRSYRISTNGFSYSDVRFLIQILERDLSIKSTMNKERSYPTIHIGAYEYFKVVDILKPHVTWSCFNHKVDASKVAEKKNTNFGAGKLNMKKAQEIRSLRKKGKDLAHLADLFGVSVNSIRNVINNVTYRTKTYAGVSVIYNPD